MILTLDEMENYIDSYKREIKYHESLRELLPVLEDYLAIHNGTNKAKIDLEYARDMIIKTSCLIKSIKYSDPATCKIDVQGVKL